MRNFLAAAAAAVGLEKDWATRSACAMAVKVGGSADSASSAMVWLARSLVAADARKVWVVVAERTAGRVAGLGRRRRRESVNARPVKSEEASRRCHRAVAFAGLQSQAGRSGC